MSNSISAPRVSAIQFEKAEFADQRPKCTACQTVLEQTYYHLAGHRICGGCAEIARAKLRKPTGSQVMKGLLYGAGMAAACSIGYAILTYVTGMEIALISILVGYLIARAIRKGTGGLGARKLQVAAVALIYFAITFSYAPLIVKGMAQAREKHKVRVSDPRLPALPGPAKAAVAGVVLALLALVTPLLMLKTGISGVLGLVIIFFGISRAWREMAPDSRLLIGPYNLSRESLSG